RIAFSVSRITTVAAGLLGLYTTPMRFISGTTLTNSSTSLPLRSGAMTLTPVTFPHGPGAPRRRARCPRRAGAAVRLAAQVTRHPMPVAASLEHWRLLRAQRKLADWTPGVERAAGRRPNRARRVALQHGAPTLDGR